MLMEANIVIQNLKVWLIIQDIPVAEYVHLQNSISIVGKLTNRPKSHLICESCR